MPNRIWEAEAESLVPEGWEIDGPPIDVPEDGDGQNLLALMYDASVVIRRIGGAFSVVAVRREIAKDLWVPTLYRGKWGSYAPGIAKPQPEAQPEAKPLLAHELPEEEEDPGDTGDPAQNGEAPPVEEWGPDAEEALAVKG